MLYKIANILAHAFLIIVGLGLIYLGLFEFPEMSNSGDQTASVGAIVLGVISFGLGCSDESL